MFNHFYIIILYYMHTGRYRYADVNYFGTYMYSGIDMKNADYFGIGTSKTHMCM